MNPEERFERLHKLRKKAKVVNYSSLYGVGAPKLAREMGVTRKSSRVVRRLLET
jgi:DNA polymerase I-like protein with 3'-5' exonuclease and polymerase domains